MFRASMPCLLLVAFFAAVPATAEPGWYDRFDALGEQCPIDEAGPLTCYFDTKGNCLRALRNFYGRRDPYHLTLVSQCEPSDRPELGAFQLRMVVL